MQMTQEHAETWAIEWSFKTSNGHSVDIFRDSISGLFGFYCFDCDEYVDVFTKPEYAADEADEKHTGEL